MITRKNEQVHFDTKDFEILTDLWEGLKAQFGHDDDLFKKKITEWINTLPEED